MAKPFVLFLCYRLFYLRIAPQAAPSAVIFGLYKAVRQLLLGVADAASVLAGLAQRGVRGGANDGFVLLCILKQLEDECHTHQLTAHNLLEVACTGVVVDGNRDLVDTRQRMQDAHVLLGGLQLVGGEDVGIAQAQVLLLIGKALTLYARHVQHVQLGNCGYQVGGLLVGHTVLVQHLGEHVAGQAQLFGRDQHDLNTGVTGECVDQRVYGSAVLEVAAKAYGQIVESALFTVDGVKVSQSLGGMAMAAVARIDHGDGSIGCGYQRSALQGVTHGNDICIAGNDLCGICNAFALGCRGRACAGNRNHVTAQAEHCCFKAESGTGRGFKKQGSQDLAVASVRVLSGVIRNVACRCNQLIQLFNGQLDRVNQTSHSCDAFLAIWGMNQAFAPLTAR